MSPPKKAIVVDTGALVSLLDATDPDHERVTELLQETSERRLIAVLVLVEVEYLVRPWPQAFPALLAEFAAGGFELLELPIQWLLRAGELLAEYRDLSLGLVDASVVASMEILGEARLATLDHRHFTGIRPAHVASLTLLP